MSNNNHHDDDKTENLKQPVTLSAIDEPKPIVGRKTDIQNPELWDFPMDYPMSIIGHEGEHDSLFNEVSLILAALFPEFDTASIVVKPSKTGRFHSLRLNLYLTHAKQVNDLYAALDEAKTVRTVL
ncbi:YbeD family protein [Psychrobacter sp. I-STPA10]|uniref:YbeD family protein n=1 Tax=Psychrobacter sp. I-STPA10 TaxID=2585769 RepID=UPI001E37C7B2|nr:DUF493 domain-containing protein [Psychrobacter sp. I-STPA10]